MPSVDGSGNLLAAGANYNADDWASVGAEASLDMLATANLNRGIDLGLGVEALARLDGAIRQYIAADVNGQAHAAARVRAQVQMPLDLFDEAGIAVRLQAIAEAAAGVQLGIGLSVDDFLSLAGDDPRLRGAPMELLKIFLEELTFQGGVMAKAAAAAMAYANLVATGSFIKRGSRLPGFTIAAEAGVGLKAGAGFRVFARFGVDDPRNLVRRTVDVAVDQTLAAIAPLLPADIRPLLVEATAPLKIALRSAFELGATLAENGGAFASADKGKLALRLAQVGLEEMQRFVLERVVEFASDQLVAALRDLDFDNAAWSAAQPQRQALADRLNALPAEAFEATAANRTYWANVVGDALSLAAALHAGGTVPPFLAEPLAIIWCGAQLLMKSVERISVASARASVIGASPVGTTVAFDGALPTTPPDLRRHINLAIDRTANAAIGQADAIRYLLRVVGHRIEEISPAAASVVTLLTGRSGAPAAEALSIVFSNLGAFVPGPDGTVNAEASLRVLRDGLRAFVNGRLDAELLPVIVSATTGAPELRTYLEEVLLSTLRTVTDTVFDTVMEWQSAGGDTQRALRELCSSLLMRVFGRSLVVTGDVLLTHALRHIQTELRQLAAASNRAGGIAPTLAGLTGLDRDLVADLVRETLEVCAETFGPMADDRRARLRELMYQMIDTTPVGADASTLESLKAAGMVGNGEAAVALAQLLGEEIAGNLIRFIQALLTRVAAALLALLAEAIADIQHAVEAWMQQIEDMAREIMARLADLLREINALQQRLDDAVDELLGHASSLLGGFAGFSGSRSTVRGKIKDAVKGRALDALADFPGYGVLHRDIRRGIERTVGNVVEAALDDDIFDPVVDVLIGLSAETADLLDDLRAIEPGDDLAVAIADIALDRIEDALREVFDGDPSMRIRFDAPVLGEVDLGRVRVPIGTFVSVVRGAVRQLGRFDNAVAGAVRSLTSVLDIEGELEAAEGEHRAASAVKQEADDRIAETRDGALDLLIAHPQPAAAITGPLTVRLRIPGGSPSLVSSDGLSHRRLFVWVNEQELPLDAARSRVEAPVATRPVPGAGLAGLTLPGVTVPRPGNLGSASGKPAAHPVARARALTFDTQRRERPPLVASARTQRGVGRESVRESARDAARAPSRRPLGAGSANGFGGISLAPLPAGNAFPPRIPADLRPLPGAAADRPVLVVEIDVPASMLHEGINALACTLVPGSARRRVERSVSFLHVAAAPSGGRRPTMPGKRTVAVPAVLEAVLTARGAAPPSAPRAREKARQVRANTWVAPAGEGKKALEPSRKRLKAELAAVAKRHAEAKTAIAGKALRPRKPAPPRPAPARPAPKGGA